MQSKETAQYAIETKDLSIFYGTFKAVSDVNMLIEKQKITAIIGPSGCGKSTLLRAFNRMNDFVPSSHVTGEILMRGQNLYGSSIDPVEVRRSIGMVFQKPNPFPKSIYENIAWGARINGFKGNMDELVEQSLRGSALWEEVKDVLQKSAYELSGGQQQRVAIARALVNKPAIIMADEPTGNLDSTTSGEILELLRDSVDTLGQTTVMVTHDAHAAAIADRVLFLADGNIVRDLGRSSAHEILEALEAVTHR